MKLPKSSDKSKLLICTGIACIFSLIFAVLIISPKNINPENISWVVNGGGDNLQHYLGWRFFRNSRWTRYILFMRDLNYPIGSSVIVTDSNPLFCLFFKLFRNVLPENFQFSGIFLLSSYLLLAVFSALIGWKLTRSIPLTIAGSVLAILNPVILQRALIHDTLTSHWLILMSVWLALNADKKWNLPGWFILVWITLLVHVYFIPMIAFVLLLQLIRMVLQKYPFFRLVALPVVFCAALFAGYFGFGYSFILPQSGSYGELSMNLNAFINPDGVSAFLSERPVLSLQYEGFNYFGIGMFLLILIGFAADRKSMMKKPLPYFLPVLGLVLLAASHKGYFDLHQIYSIELPASLYGLFSVFRSSGRLVWPLYYLVLFGTLSVVGSRSKQILFCVLPALCAAVQIADLAPFYNNTADRFRNPANELAVLPPDLTEAIPDNAEHLYCASGVDAGTQDSLAFYAVEHHMTFNLGANARGIKHIFGGDPLDLSLLECSQIREKSVYVYPNGIAYPFSLRDCADVINTVIDDETWTVIKPIGSADTLIQDSD